MKNKLTGLVYVVGGLCLMGLAFCLMGFDGVWVQLMTFGIGFLNVIVGLMIRDELRDETDE